MSEQKKEPVEALKGGLQELENEIVELQGMVGDGPAAHRLKLLKPKVDSLQKLVGKVEKLLPTEAAQA